MTDSTGPRRRLLLLVAVPPLALLLSGCEASQPLQSWWGLNQAKSDFARDLWVLMNTILLAAAVVFIVVEAVLFLAVFRFRARRAGALPRQTHGNTPIEVIWTIMPAVVLAFVAIPTVRTIFASYHPERTGPVDLQVQVIGHQWWWEFRYPPELGITTANELHFPAGQRVAVAIESADVIHAFWFPELAGKRDAIPTHVNELAWTADRPGVYYGQCTQLCGTSHANMRMRAVAHDAAGWQSWVQAMQAANGTPAQGAPEQIARGHRLVTTGACVTCHTIKGTPLQARVGPDLTRFGDRTTFGAGMYPNTQENLIRWLKNPSEAKPGNKMPNLGLSDEDAAAIAAYLRSLR
jgi:cytochrome c oxidase subunit 2